MRDSSSNQRASGQACGDSDGAEPTAGGFHVELADPERRLAAAQKKWLEGQWARAAAVAVGGADGAHGEVRGMIVGDARMTELHERHSNVAGTTDVLTFDLSPAGEGSERGRPGSRMTIDGDIVVCFDEAERQATARGIPVERELLLYLLHGVLHCLGHDDHTEDDYEAMHAREDEILAAIGVGATFGANERGTGVPPVQSGDGARVAGAPAEGHRRDARATGEKKQHRRDACATGEKKKRGAGGGA